MTRKLSRAGVTAAAVILATAAAGCGGSSSTASTTKSAGARAPEASPAGDIPDNQAFVPYALPGGGFTVKVPEGWSRTGAGGAVTFTDKLNAIRLETVKAAAAPTARGERARAGAGAHVTKVTRKAGTAIRATYLADAKPNAVTGKAGKNAVERYVFFHRGQDVVLTLSGPKGADNVDPWKIVTDSVRFTR